MLHSVVDQPVLHSLLDHWIEVRGTRVMPTRDDIDPTRIASSLPYLWICRRGEDGEFTCVLAGEEIQLAWGHSIMNRPMAEFFGDDYGSVVKGRLNRVLDTPAIQHAVFRVGDQLKSVERLCLPVADGDGRPIQVFGGSVYQFDQQQRPDPTLSLATKSPRFYHTQDLVPIPEPTDRERP